MNTHSHSGALIESNAIVTDMIRQSHDTQTIRLKLPNITSPFLFKPGQFIVVRPELEVRPTMEKKVVPRGYSISSSPTKALLAENPYIEITVRQTPDPFVSKWLNDRQVGDIIPIKGPYGKFFWDETDPQAEHILLLGGGCGIAPMYSIYSYLQEKHPAQLSTLIYSVKTQEDLSCYHDLCQMKANMPNSKLICTLSREPENSTWQGPRGRINLELLQQELQRFNLQKTKCYLCGTPDFVNTLVEALEKAGVAKDHILHEAW